MAQSFPEKAHLNTDQEKYAKNFDAIDWGKKKEVDDRDPKEKERQMILDHCANETFGGHYCGLDEGVQLLIDDGLMEFKYEFVNLPYYGLTEKGIELMKDKKCNG